MRRAAAWLLTLALLLGTAPSVPGAMGAIDPLRNEPKTPGYALLNLRSGYEWENFQINLGIENLFDKRYYHPLGGVDYSEWTRHKSTGQVGALPAPGRSFNAAVTVKF